jgi:hypothetical protein
VLPLSEASTAIAECEKAAKQVQEVRAGISGDGWKNGKNFNGWNELWKIIHESIKFINGIMELWKIIHEFIKFISLCILVSRLMLIQIYWEDDLDLDKSR